MKVSNSKNSAILAAITAALSSLPDTATTEVVENPNEGFLALLNKNVEIRCNVYIYCGKLVGVNSTCVKLDNAHIVYETGPHGDSKYKIVERIGDGQYVSLGLVESFGPTYKKF